MILVANFKRGAGELTRNTETPIWIQKEEWIGRRPAILLEQHAKSSYVRYVDASDPHRRKLVPNRYITERQQQ